MSNRDLARAASAAGGRAAPGLDPVPREAAGRRGAVSLAVCLPVGPRRG